MLDLAVACVTVVLLAYVSASFVMTDHLLYAIRALTRLPGSVFTPKQKDPNLQHCPSGPRRA